MAGRAPSRQLSSDCSNRCCESTGGCDRRRRAWRAHRGCARVRPLPALSTSRASTARRLRARGRGAASAGAPTRRRRPQRMGRGGGAQWHRHRLPRSSIARARSSSLLPSASPSLGCLALRSPASTVDAHPVPPGRPALAPDHASTPQQQNVHTHALTHATLRLSSPPPTRVLAITLGSCYLSARELLAPAYRLSLWLCTLQPPRGAARQRSRKHTDTHTTRAYSPARAVSLTIFS